MASPEGADDVDGGAHALFDTARAGRWLSRQVSLSLASWLTL